MPTLLGELDANRGSADPHRLNYNDEGSPVVHHVTGLDHNLANPVDWTEVWRETSLLSVIQDKDHVASVKRFFTESITQLKEELTTFKKERPDLPWDMDQAGGD